MVVSVLDYTAAVKGKGIQLLRNQGVKVTTGVLASEGAELSIIRNTFVAKRRPFIALKYAQSRDGFMGVAGKQVWISNQWSKRLSHKLRNRFDAILVGTQTALIDNPSLDNRLWFGSTPVKVLIDRELKVPPAAKLFHSPGTTYVICERENDGAAYPASVRFVGLKFDKDLLTQMLNFLASQNISSLLVEGGAATLKHFIDEGLWDEAWIFTSDKLLGQGIAAPRVAGVPAAGYRFGSDLLSVIHAASRREFSSAIAKLSASS